MPVPLKKCPLRPWVLLLPMALTAAAVNKTSYPLLFLSFPLLFVCLRLLPWAKKRENLAMFCLVSLWSLPPNLYFIKRILPLLQNGRLPLLPEKLRALLWIILIFSSLFSLEQLALGLLTRLLFRRQKPLPPPA